MVDGWSFIKSYVRKGWGNNLMDKVFVVRFDDLSLELLVFIYEFGKSGGCL